MRGYMPEFATIVAFCLFEVELALGNILLEARLTEGFFLEFLSPSWSRFRPLGFLSLFPLNLSFLNFGLLSSLLGVLESEEFL